jgi:uncharacterized protein YeaO (DUF488 family)
MSTAARARRLPAPQVEVAVKRIYDKRSPDDGLRVLVDRLWPRGVSRRRAALDEWMAELAPSTALREWFGHEPSRWAEFQRRYRAELRSRGEAIEALRRLATAKRVTLLYAARDPLHNNAEVLKKLIEGDEGRRTT